MNTHNKYNIAITGGGLAGLSVSILLSRLGYRVCLFEKETYPFHRVCGEYVSMESWDFLSSLGLPLESWQLPKIRELTITSPTGVTVNTSLPTGGFGISRFKLDAALAELAKKSGVAIYENTKVNNIRFDNDQHLIESSAGLFYATVALACYGKKSNLDVKWKRKFINKSREQNYIGVKYHVKIDLPDGQIALHNFPGGYCGISKIENGLHCMCYLTKAKNLRVHQQSISVMEEKILKKNPAIKKILENGTFIFKEPVTIAQISFAKKSLIEDHVLCLGDAAGMITPLCGNGMSMALQAAKIASLTIKEFLENKLCRTQMEQSYKNNWQDHFSKRLRTGRIVQKFFGSSFRSTLLLKIMRPFPFLIRTLIRQTHGENF